DRRHYFPGADGAAVLAPSLSQAARCMMLSFDRSPVSRVRGARSVACASAPSVRHSTYTRLASVQDARVTCRKLFRLGDRAVVDASQVDRYLTRQLRKMPGFGTVSISVG